MIITTNNHFIPLSLKVPLDFLPLLTPLHQDIATLSAIIIIIIIIIKLFF